MAPALIDRWTDGTDSGDSPSLEMPLGEVPHRCEASLRALPEVCEGENPDGAAGEALGRG